MTPDDMEGRLTKLAAMPTVDLIMLDAYGRASATFGDLRALLLDYQERGRALERVTDLLASANRSTDRPSDYVSRAVMEARAVLNQKGDER